MAGNVTLEGMDEILDRLKKLGQRSAPAENQALYAGAKIVRDNASQRAPRSLKAKEHLADNIVISEPKQDENGKYVEVGPKAPFFYGKFLEYGTSKMTARPFMGPAQAESKKQVLETIRQTLKAGLDL
ncbi:MAG: HK97-gp10 family putative phage morphogenesis protein [Syntrophomonadaceae bacterium]